MAMSTEALPSLTTAALAGLSAGGLSLFLTPLVRRAAVRFGWVAKPVEDRWGRRVVARFGGVAIFVGFVVPAWIWVPKDRAMIGLLIGASLSFVLGLIDDFHRMRPYTKLLGQLLIGCVVVMSGIHIDLIPWRWLSIPVSVLWLVLVMNAFNLLDNMDGLAAGTGAIGAGFCAVHAALAGQWPVVTLNAILAGACLGFLRYNFPPAKIYMGDSGSHLFGLSLAALSLLGTWRHSTELVSVLVVPTLVLALPIFDTCFVMIQRLAHRMHPFMGGTDHVSHRLAVLGLSTRQTVLALYGISVCVGLLSLVSVNLNTVSTVTLWVLVMSILVLFGRYLTKVNRYRLTERASQALSLNRSGPVTPIETMLLYKRQLVEILVDFCLLSSAYVFAYLLRFEGTLTSDLQRLIIQSLPIVLVIKLVCFAGCGLYRGVWRYLGLSDLIAVVKAVTMGSILSALILLYLFRFAGYSRAVLIIDWMLCLLAVGGSRVLERLLDEWIRGVTAQGIPVLIIGAGDTGARVLRSLKYEGQSARRVVGFLDDDPRKRLVRLDGTPVLGGRGRLTELLDQDKIQEVLVAINDPPGDLLEHVQQCCQPRGCAWRVVTAGITETA